MAKTDNLNDFLADIAKGIQLAENESAPYTINPQDFRAHIETLKKVSGTKTITSAGTHDVSSYANAEVGTGSVTVSGGGLTAGNGSVTAAAVSATGLTLTATTTKPTTGPYITATGSGAVSRAAITKTQGAGYITATTNASVSAATSANSKTATIYYTLSTKNSDNVSISGAKTTVPAGYYPNGAEKTMGNGAYTISGGGLSGGGSVTPTVSLASGSDTNMGNITIGAKDATNYPYYFKVGATSTSGSKTITRAVVTATQTAGYIPANTTAATKISAGSATVTISQGSGSAYVGLKEGKYTVAGGGLTSGAGTVVAAMTATGITLGTAATTAPTSGPYITVSGSGKVSMAAVTATQTAGYLPATTTAKTLVSAVSNKSSNTATRYYPITGVDRADTTIGVTAHSTNKTLTITATNNQSQGYQGGGNKTATATVTLSSNSNTVTASVGTISVATTIGTAFSGTTIAPNRTTQTVVPAGRYTTGNVYVSAIPDAMVDTTSGTATAGEILSGKKAWVDGAEITGTIATKTSSNLTASGAKVTVPAGYYATEASKTIGSGAAAVSGGALSASTGSVSATSGGVTLIATASKPSSGYYITATGSGKVTQATITLSKTAGYISGGASTYKSAATISSSASTAHYVISTQEKEVTPTTSQQTITPDSGKLLSQVIVKGYTESGLSLKTYAVKITSSVGSATAYYTAGDGKQYSKTLSTTQQTMYAAEKTTLRVVGPSNTYCTLNGGSTLYPVTDEGNTVCIYFPAVPALVNDGGTVTLTLDATPAKVDTSSGDATAAQILTGKKAWVDGVEVTGTMPQIGLPKPVITINNNTGVISAYVDMEDETPGYVPTSAYSNDTKTLTTKAGGTIKPSTSATQTWAKGTFLTSTLTVAKEPNLTAGNIKSGVSICGVTGTYTGSGSGGTTLGKCTVTLNLNTFSAFGNNVEVIGYTTTDGSTINSTYQEFGDTSSVTLSNVLCGSCITVYHNIAGIVDSKSSNITIVREQGNCTVIKAPTTNGATGSVEFYEDT